MMIFMVCAWVLLWLLLCCKDSQMHFLCLVWVWLVRSWLRHFHHMPISFLKREKWIKRFFFFFFFFINFFYCYQHWKDLKKNIRGEYVRQKVGLLKEQLLKQQEKSFSPSRERETFVVVITELFFFFFFFFFFLLFPSFSS